VNWWFICKYLAGCKKTGKGVIKAYNQPDLKKFSSGVYVTGGPVSQQHTGSSINLGLSKSWGLRVAYITCTNFSIICKLSRPLCMDNFIYYISFLLIVVIWILSAKFFISYLKKYNLKISKKNWYWLSFLLLLTVLALCYTHFQTDGTFIL
jgi:hypothetical protein